MKRDIRLYLDDIIEAIDKILNYTEGMTLAQFRKDGKTMDAVVRNFSVLGEAAKNIPSATRENHSGIPWKEMAGMRDKLIHSYFGINDELLWETIEKRLPTLKIAIQKVLEETETP